MPTNSLFQPYITYINDKLIYYLINFKNRKQLSIKLPQHFLGEINLGIIYLVRSQNFPKNSYFLPLIHTRANTYQGVKNVSFSETFFVLTIGMIACMNVNKIWSFAWYCLTHFVPSVPFYTHLKTENQRISDVFRVYSNGKLPSRHLPAQS